MPIAHHSHHKLAFIAWLMLAICWGPTLAADRVSSAANATTPADSVFAEVATAWQNGDEELMADLVHRDGLRVTHGGDYNRFTIYSPDQSFYYFKDLFRGCDTLEFLFRRLQDSSDGHRSHGMVEWQYKLPGRESAEKLKLVVVLSRQDDHWRLSELNSISQR